MKNLIKFTQKPKLEKPSLIVGWAEDVGRLGAMVIDCLNKKLMNRSFCQLNPVNFFSLGGVEIKGNVAFLPEGRGYAGARNDLIVFFSDLPHFNQHTFLNAILDVAQYSSNAEELYTISGLTSLIPHTIPRRTFAVYNEPALQEKLRGYGLHDISYEGPPHINSYLLWAAKRRGLRGVSLWPQIPFYLAPGEDPYAVRLTLAFFKRRFDLDIDLTEWDKRIREQNQKMSQLRSRNPEIHASLERLETGLSLNEEEELKLVEEVSKFLKKRPEADS
jgi:proteasome assembly chaperone (PAC2) family protein